MLLNERTGGALERPVKSFQSLSSNSCSPESEQTTMSLLRFVSNAPVCEVHNCGGGVFVTTRCQMPPWNCQRSAYVVLGSTPPNIQMRFACGSAWKTASERAGGVMFGSESWFQ